jgi:hypothetical protein
MSRLLCWLGFHSLIWGQRDDPNGQPSSLVGGCVRCNRPFQWDF